MIKLDCTEPPLNPQTFENCQLCLALKNELELLKQEIALLKEKLYSNSNNSSKPPSTDFKKKKLNRKKSARKPGGQLGHKGVSRQLVPIQQVDTVIKCPPPEMGLDANK